MKGQHNIPNEVIWVKTIQEFRRPVGLQLYQEMVDIIDRNPAHFRWEHIYKKIPVEVHDSFKAEAFPVSSTSETKGLLQHIREESVSVDLSELAEVGVLELLNRHHDKVNALAMEKENYLNRLKIIWRKHYGKFGLTFREP